MRSSAFLNQSRRVRRAASRCPSGIAAPSLAKSAQLIARSEAILNEIFSNAPLAVKFSLKAVNDGLETTMAEGLALEASYFGICAGTEDKKEGTSAFLEKRKPQFQGR